MAPLVDQDESWSYAWSLLLGVGWVLFAVGLVEVVLAWYPVRAANPAWELGVAERCVTRLPLVAIGLALVAAAAVLTERRRAVSLVATLALALGLATVVAYLTYLAHVPSALHVATPQTAPHVRTSIVRVTFASAAFSALFFGTGGWVIRYLRRNPI